MTDSNTDSPAQTQPEALPQPTEATTPKLKTFDLNQAVDRVTDAMATHLGGTGRITGWLMFAVIATFGGLSCAALFLGHVDTSEKLAIALISFLGGSAIFSGTPKK